MDETQDAAGGISSSEDDDARIVDIRQYWGDRHAVEQRLLRIRRLAAVGASAGGIVHDCNNLLAIVDAQLDLIDEACAAHPAVRPHVFACERAVGRSASLARAMLLALRDHELRSEILDSLRAVDGLIELARHALEPNIRIQSNHAPGLWRCRADPTQVLNPISSGANGLVCRRGASRMAGPFHSHALKHFNID